MDDKHFIKKVPGYDKVYVLSHPLALHYLAHLRDIQTKPPLFRTITKKITTLLGIVASFSLKTKIVEKDTPLEKFSGEILNEQIIAIPILRAGLGMLDPILELFPDVSVGYVGIQRDHETALPVEYYSKLPELKDKIVFLLDPMLATGGSASFACQLIKKQGPKKIIMLSVVSAPEGIAQLTANHPDIEIFTAALDRELNQYKYILPGLGDMGDRLYGTD